MKKHKYSHVVDDIEFTGSYERELVDEYAIFTICTLEVQGIDLMLVVDPRVVHEIERVLLDDWLWNEDRV